MCVLPSLPTGVRRQTLFCKRVSVLGMGVSTSMLNGLCRDPDHVWGAGLRASRTAEHICINLLPFCLVVLLCVYSVSRRNQVVEMLSRTDEADSLSRTCPVSFQLPSFQELLRNMMLSTPKSGTLSRIGRPRRHRARCLCHQVRHSMQDSVSPAKRQQQKHQVTDDAPALVAVPTLCRPR
jgi:hypothetical protein